MMIRQNHTQDTLPSSVMMGPDDHPLLTCHAKALLLHPAGSNIHPLSKHNRLSHTPGLHLSAPPGQGFSVPLKPSSSSSSSCSSSSALAGVEESSESQREAENFPPRRPLKLAPLELPLEVKEAQWQKMRSVQKEAKVPAHKLEAVGGEPCEWSPWKVKACGTDGVVKSPTRAPLTTIINPYKLQQRSGRALLLPVTQLPLPDADRSVGKEAGPKERNPIPGFKFVHLSCAGQLEHVKKTTGQSTHPQQTAGQSDETMQMTGQSAEAENTANQSTHTEVQDLGCRRRARLRRAQRLEEDQSKSGSSAGLWAEEGKPGSARPGPAQRSTEKAPREVCRVLDKASRRTEPGTMLLSRAEETTAG